MEKRILTIWAMVAVILALAGGSAGAVEYTHIWVDQGTGINDPCTPGTPEEPFKSITYALARADFLGWPEPWHVHIGPGVYDANSAKPGPEREIFPIELRQDMIFEGSDAETCVIDGQHLYEGLCPLLLGQNLTGLEIRGLTFRNMDHSTGNGGAIELIECSGLIENCVVQNCSALSGGGLWLSPRSTPVPFDFVACSFIENTATNSPGGGVYVTAALTGDIANCTFTDNAVTAYAWGGGFGINGTLTGSITGSTFSGNSAKYNGGGGFYINGNLEGDIGNCGFTDNSLSANNHCYGGGFRITSTINGNISNCNFTNNSISTTSYDNSYGGGFCVGTLNGSISGCSFANNTVYAQTDSYARGGGFYIGTLNNDIVNCTFSGNSAEDYGGGFYVSGSLTGNILGCSFDENSGDGAGFRVGTMTGDIKGCEFFNWPSLAASRALRLDGTFDGVMENCQFFDFMGDAVRLLSDNATTAKIRSCLFVAPVTLGEVSGWAVRTSQKTIISNNTMVGPGLGTPPVPYLPSAIYIEFNTQAETGQIFNNIVVDTQCAIHVDAAVDMPITYNQFYNINEIVCQGEQGLGNDIWWLEQLLANFRYNDYGDPCFIPGDSMYRIQGTSPCADTGDPNYVPEAGESDIEGQPRMADGSIDRGADEYYTYTLTADFYHDGIVNFLDYALLTSYWQQDEPLVDIAPPGGDGIVNFLDLGVLVDEWLLTEPWY